MKNVLRGLNRPFFLTLATFVGALSVGTTMTAKPTYAFGCACVPALEKLMGSNGNNCNCIGDKLKEYLGVGDGKSAQPKFKDDPEKLDNGGSFKSITEYYENVWWPRYIHTQKLIESSQLGAAALNEARAGSLADAQQVSETAARQQDKSADIMLDQLGVPENSCGDISLLTSQNYLREQVRQISSDISQRLAKRTSGGSDAEGPAVNLGPDNSKTARYKDLVDRGLVSGQGNNGGNQKAGITGSGAVTDANILSYQTVLQDPEQAEILLELVTGNMFQDILRQDNLAGGVNNINGPALYDQTSYQATVSLLQQPLIHRIAELTPVSGVQAKQYIERAFERAGYDASSAAEHLGPGGTISKAGADLVIHELRMNDPSQLVEKVTEAEPNLLRTILTTMYQQNSLLYNINETLKNMHMTLAANGLILSDGRKEEVEKKIRALNRGN